MQRHVALADVDAVSVHSERNIYSDDTGVNFSDKEIVGWAWVYLSLMMIGTLYLSHMSFVLVAISRNYVFFELGYSLNSRII